MSTNIRFIAAQVIADVLQGKSLAEALPTQLTTLSVPKDRAFVQAVSFGVCRYYVRLQFYLQQLLQKPLKAKDKLLHALLLIGLYQLLEMRVPAHAAVAETVAAGNKLKQPWAKGLINAILREFIRKQMTLQTMVVNQVDAYYAHPLWWVEKIKSAWPEEWQQILHENNEHPPFAIRVNARHHSRQDYLALLKKAGMEAQTIAGTQSGIVLENAVAVDALPGFKEGEVSIQDGAAQLAAEFLSLSKDLRILDACSAPGGKLLHILESEPQLTQVVAVEKEKKRMSGIHENLERLFPAAKLANVQLINQDAVNTAAWWDKQPFDRILLDAPCSASGVIRRHPDIKLLRQANDIQQLAEEQARLLRALWPLLAQDGLFLYATCSIFPEENNDIIKHFLAEQDDVRVEQIEIVGSKPCDFGLQILPGTNGMDGFYYCLLRKI